MNKSSFKSGDLLHLRFASNASVLANFLIIASLQSGKKPWWPQSMADIDESEYDFYMGLYQAKLFQVNQVCQLAIEKDINRYKNRFNRYKNRFNIFICQFLEKGTMRGHNGWYELINPQ